MLAQRLPGLLPALTRERVAGGHRDPFGGRAAVRRHAADHPAAVRGAAPHLQRRRARRRRQRAWRARARSAARTAACCSSTSAPRSEPACWKHCELRWRTARSGWPAVTAWRGIRRGSSWCWPPTRARARPPIPRDCICAAAVKRRYLGKLSGPLLDRVDLRVQMHPVRAGALRRPRTASRPRRCGSGWPRRARRPRERWRAIRRPDQRRGQRVRCCAARFRPSTEAMAPLRTALDRGVLSIRGVDRTLAGRVDACRPGRAHVAETRRCRDRAELPATGSVRDERRSACSAPGRICRGSPSRRARSWRRWWPTSALSRRPHRVRRGDGADRPGARVPRLDAAIDCAAEDLDLLAARGGRLVTPDDDEWPLLAFTAFGVGEVRKQAARRTRRWCCGRSARRGSTTSRERSAAIVGTRAATAYGEHVAADLAAGLVERDVAVVSGGALRNRRRGAPRDAGGRRHHRRGARRRHRHSLSGRAFRAAASDIGQHGLLVTEYPPGVRPARHRFLTRNRLVAALVAATVVVEAGLRSGAANTAAWARALGRVVCAVPGPVTSSASAGCHQLLRRGAELVTRADEIVELVGRSRRIGRRAGASGVAARRAAPTASRRCTRRCPPAALRTVDQIAVASRPAAEQVLGPLAMLEIAGLVEKVDGRWRLVRC